MFSLKNKQFLYFMAKYFLEMKVNKLFDTKEFSPWKTIYLYSMLYILHGSQNNYISVELQVM